MPFRLSTSMLSGHPVTVLGGGIGGLAAAFVLARHGAEVTLLEQAARIREVGAGLQISPNGVAVLAALGLDRALAERSVAAEEIRLFDQGGHPLQALPLSALPSDRPWLLAHRADLVAVLAAAAQAAGVDIRLGVRVAGVDHVDGRAVLTLADGQSEAAALLVGADGVRSVTRRFVDGGDAARFTGQTAWRAIVPLTGPAAPRVRVFVGSGRHVVMYPLRDCRHMNVVAVAERDVWTAEGWSQPADPVQLRNDFSDFCGDVREILDRVERAHLWGLFRHPVARDWHRGPVVLLGDAAHPTLPFLAQGACMALEDAWILGQCLSAAGSVADGLAAYQLRRRARCVRVVSGADRNGWAFHLRPGPTRLMAHAALRLAGQVAPTAALRRFDWLYGHDVTAADRQNIG